MMKKSAVAVAIALGFTSTAFAAIDLTGSANFGIDSNVASDNEAIVGTSRNAELSMNAAFSQEINEDLTFSAGASFGSSQLLETGNEGAVEFNATASLTHTTLGKLSIGEVGNAYGGHVFTKLDGWNPGGEEEDNAKGYLYEGTFAGVGLKASHTDSSFEDATTKSITSASANYTLGSLTVAGSVRDASGDRAMAFGAKYADLIDGLGLNAGVGIDDGTNFGFGADYVVPGFEGLTTYAGAQVTDSTSFRLGADYAVNADLSTGVEANFADAGNDYKVSAAYTLPSIAGVAPKLDGSYKIADAGNQYDLGVSASIFGINAYAKTGHNADGDNEGTLTTRIGASYSISF